MMMQDMMGGMMGGMGLVGLLVIASSSSLPPRS